MTPSDAPVPGLPSPDPDELHAAEFAVREELAEGNLGLVDYSLPILLAEYDRRGAALSDYSESMGEYDRMAAEQRELRIIHEIVCAELSVARRRIDDLLAECDRRADPDHGLLSPYLHVEDIRQYLRPEGEQ